MNDQDLIIESVKKILKVCKEPIVVQSIALLVVYRNTGVRHWVYINPDTYPNEHGIIKALECAYDALYWIKHSLGLHSGWVRNTQNQVDYAIVKYNPLPVFPAKALP